MTKANTIKYFDKEEQELIEAIESTKVKDDTVLAKSEQMQIAKVLQSAAQNTHAKRKSVNLRIQERDLFNFKVRAAQDGMPYQTLMSSILHRYISGRLTV